MKLNKKGLSQSEGDLIMAGIGLLIDIIVRKTGGKPLIGGDKKK